MTTNDQPNDGFPVRSPDYREGFSNAMRAMNLIYGQPAPAAGSDTPRTDEQERRYDRIYGAFEGDRRELVYVDFARQLEREADAYAKVLHDSLAREDALYKQLTAAQAKIVELEQDKA
jgi:hypothetical protein